MPGTNNEDDYFANSITKSITADDKSFTVTGDVTTTFTSGMTLRVQDGANEGSYVVRKSIYDGTTETTVTIMYTFPATVASTKIWYDSNLTDRHDPTLVGSEEVYFENITSIIADCKAVLDELKYRFFSYSPVLYHFVAAVNDFTEHSTLQDSLDSIIALLEAQLYDYETDYTSASPAFSGVSNIHIAFGGDPIVYTGGDDDQNVADTVVKLATLPVYLPSQAIKISFRVAC